MYPYFKIRLWQQDISKKLYKKILEFAFSSAKDFCTVCNNQLTRLFTKGLQTSSNVEVCLSSNHFFFLVDGLASFALLTEVSDAHF